MGAPLIMLGLGLAQGAMAYQQGQEQKKAALINADNARKMQEYEKQVRDSNVASVQAASKAQQEQQDISNQMGLGRATAAMGASGVQITGTFMDVLGQEVMLGANKVAMIRAQGLRQETGARNAGDLAVYRQDYAEYQYSQQARAASRSATMGLIMGAVSGAAGFSAAGGQWGNMFGNTALTGFTGGSAFGGNSIGYGGGVAGGSFGGNSIGYGGGFGGYSFG
tara:strand:+ start:4900 stop:5568 length:669 start_codon:yes stop_codon:yes gene_type:complete